MRAAALFLAVAVLNSIGGADAVVRIATRARKIIHGYNPPPAEVLGKKCSLPTAGKECHGYACLEHGGVAQCSTCVRDRECELMSEVFACNLGVPGEPAGDCVLKPLSWLTLSRNEIIAGVCAFFISAFSSVAGIGGGGMLVPLYILGVGLPPGLAVSMSQATILGGAGLNMVIKMVRSHPERSGPLIDYDVAMMMMPMTLTGTVVGHMTGRVMPDWLRLGGLVILLSYMLKKTLKKAAKSAKNDGVVAVAEEDIQLLVKGGKGDDGAVSYDRVRLEEAVAYRRRQIPLNKLGFMLALWCILVYSSYIKHQYVSCGSMMYWAMIMFEIGSCLALTCLAGTMLQKRDAEMRELGYEPKKDEIEWTWESVLIYPAISITAGMGASLLGIGGGMILGIIFNEIGKMDEQVMAATAALATALVACKASTEFWVFGEMPLDYAAYFIACGCLGTVVGQGPIDYYIRLKQKKSWIIYSLAAIIAGSLVALSFAGALTVYRTWVAGGNMGMAPLCKHG